MPPNVQSAHIQMLAVVVSLQDFGNIDHAFAQSIESPAGRNSASFDAGRIQELGSAS